VIQAGAFGLFGVRKISEMLMGWERLKGLRWGILYFAQMRKT